MKKLLFIFIILFFCRVIAGAQCTPAGTGLTAMATATAASCPLTGSVAINITGSISGAPYTFILSGACLSVALTQSQSSPNYTFTSLQGNCTYTACISDAGGNIISKTVTVADNYPAYTAIIPMDTMFSTIACSRLTTTVTGGRAPYSYELFLGLTASGSPVQGPQASNVFTGISPATQYTVRVTDACNQSVIATRFTGSLIAQTMSANSGVLESCTSIREMISLNNLYGGVYFSNNNIGNATAAGLIFPITITAKDHTGAVISGYPYVLNAGVPASWGQSPNTGLFPDLRWSPPIPNNPSLFPVTFSYTAGCGAAASAVCTYDNDFARAAYALTNGALIDTSQCPVKNCFRFSIGGDYIGGNFYAIGAYTNPAATGTPIQTISYPGQSDICGLDFSTTYYFKVHDPCLNKDTIIVYATGPALPAFTVTPTNCNTYCSGNVRVQFNYTGLIPNSVVADSGPASYGPYPKSITFQAGALSAATGIISITDLPPGAYHFTFRNKCGETAVGVAVLEAGNLFASPLHSVVYTGCVTANVTITPHISASGKMLEYHTTPGGCYPLSGVGYHAGIIFQQISGGAPLPASGDIAVDNPNYGYTVTVNTPGIYKALISYYEGSVNLVNSVSYCIQATSDTFAVAFISIPTIVRIYTLPCAGNTYSIAAVSPNALPGTLYTLYASNGTTILAGPQTSNIFNNISNGLGTGLSVKAQDPCGQSSVAPVSQNTSTVISGAVNCFSFLSGGAAASGDSLRADFINGATYVWTAPDGTVFTGATPPPVIPAQAGTWTLSTTVQAGTCSSVLTNSFTTVDCSQVTQGNPTDPRADTIHLSGAVSFCKTTLTWITQQEINSLRFDIEESDDNVNWVRIGVVTAAGNSSTPRTYSFVVDPSAKHKFYRIRQTDTDGRIKYSNTVEIDTDCDSGTDILTGTGPVIDIFTFYFPSSAARGNAYLVFVDAIGREYFRRPVVINRGMNIYQFMPQQILAKGTYMVRLVSADGRWRSNTVKVVHIK